jgi:hypothetical protein
MVERTRKASMTRDDILDDILEPDVNAGCHTVIARGSSARMVWRRRVGSIDVGWEMLQAAVLQIISLRRAAVLPVTADGLGWSSGVTHCTMASRRPRLMHWPV